MSRRKAKVEKDRIILSEPVRQRLAAMIGPLNQFLAGVRLTLDVPNSWGLVNDQNGFPVAFVAPPEPKKE